MATQDQRRADPVRQSVGSLLKAAREAVGLSQQEVAKKFEISDKTISAWEKGLGDPGIYRLIEIAKLYQCTADYLLGGAKVSLKAMKMAVRYDAMTLSDQRQFEALWMGYMARAATDEEIEEKMPITADRKRARNGQTQNR